MSAGVPNAEDVLAALHALTMAVARSDHMLDAEEMWEPFSRAVNLIARVKGAAEALAKARGAQ